MNKLKLIQTVKDKTELSKQEAIDVAKLFIPSLTVGVNTFQQVNT